MNIEKLKGILPDNIFNELPTVISKFEINTPLRMSHFLGQCSHESGNFKVFNENLNYSADRLLVVFPKYFKNVKAADYNRNPQKIANLVYASRMGNGNEASGDGYKYRGRGVIQLTGKSNYISFGNAIGEDIASNPDIVATKYALTSAAWFFWTNSLNKIADKGTTDEVCTSITKAINGGYNGLDDRKLQFKKYYTLLK